MGISLLLTRAEGEDSSGVTLHADETLVTSVWIQHDCPEDHTEGRLGLTEAFKEILCFLGWDDRLKINDKGHVDDPWTELFETYPWEDDSE